MRAGIRDESRRCATSLFSRRRSPCPSAMGFFGRCVSLMRSPAAVEGGSAWAVRYSLVLDYSWATRSAHVSNLTPAGRSELQLETDGNGGWHVNGEARSPTCRWEGDLNEQTVRIAQAKASPAVSESEGYSSLTPPGPKRDTCAMSDRTMV